MILLPGWRESLWKQGKLLKNAQVPFQVGANPQLALNTDHNFGNSMDGLEFGKKSPDLPETSGFLGDEESYF